MGYFMASNLARKTAHNVVVFNRTASKCEELAKEFPNVTVIVINLILFFTFFL
jgi:glutamyl-tRNA reductase